ncbi:unnamed protein product [Parnassius mnemosyne]|uniref:Uncharacterized protein n=1 Tax=Parnassius mnemosyne TaxID=213953 RepID=A0AAV1LA72_9NEOP
MYCIYESPHGHIRCKFLTISRFAYNSVAHLLREEESKTLALQQELIGICKTAGFPLHKWHSNSPAILAIEKQPARHGERPENVPFSEMENDKRVKVLGLQ